MKIRAFNLIPGAVFQLGWLTGDRPLVVTKVDRNSDAEEVDVTFRVGGDDGGIDNVAMDFCELVELVGLCVNEDDFDDFDFGV